MFSFLLFTISMVCLFKSGWLVTESAAAYLMDGLEGVFRVFDRRFDGLSDLLIEGASFLVSSGWILCKTYESVEDSDASKHPEKRACIDSNSANWSSIRNDWVDDGNEAFSPTINDQSSFDDGEYESFGSSDQSSWQDLAEPSINPANGLPMIGSIDIEGNPFGTDSSDHCSTIDDDLSGSCLDDFSDFDTFDSFSDDISSGFDDGITD